VNRNELAVPFMESFRRGQEDARRLTDIFDARNAKCVENPGDISADAFEFLIAKDEGDEARAAEIFNRTCKACLVSHLASIVLCMDEPGAIRDRIDGLAEDKFIRGDRLDGSRCEPPDDVTQGLQNRLRDQRKVRECIDALEWLGVYTNSGAPKARTALRSSGYRFTNEVICKAVAIRKQAEADRIELRQLGFA
jgi:hypothetical protein